MCGIYGIFHLDGSAADPAHMPAMGRTIVHRGPDDEGHHADGPCAIGMRRLSIIDPRAATSLFPTKRARCGWCATGRSTIFASCAKS
jgi:asparagine synthetase B (glutamine-hydrolysing)